MGGPSIRRVPPNWEHPKDEKGDYIPMYNETFEEVAEEWKKEYIEWENKTHEYYTEGEEFWEDKLPPDRYCYRSKFTVEPTWYQLYQNVSEGTPISPPFATEEELARYLSEHGDFWHQDSYYWNKPTYEQAIALVKAGDSSSMIITEGKILEPYQQAEHFNKESS